MFNDILTNGASDFVGTEMPDFGDTENSWSEFCFIEIIIWC